MKLALGLRQIYQFSKAYADTALCYTKTHEWVQYLAA